MAYRRIPFAPDEWYHCFTRTVDKRNAFRGNADMNRFLELLYLSNDIQNVRRADFQNASHIEILQRQRKQPIVSIGAYCLMPNHFHILLQETQEGGITSFMRKVGTGYAMYFNLKYNRIGNLFVKPFRSRHVDDDSYFKKVASYIHLNPLELFELRWKEGIIPDFDTAEDMVAKYSYSSLPDIMTDASRPQLALLDQAAVSLIREDTSPLKEQILDATEYYADFSEAERTLMS